MGIFKNKTADLINKTASATAKAVATEFGIPNSGGNFYTQNEQLKATESVINTFASSRTLNNIFNAKNNTYNLWFLLQQQADYWSRIVGFEIDKTEYLKTIYQALRIAVIYGRSLIEFSDGKLITYYINTSKANEYDEITIANVCKASSVLMSQDVHFKPTNTYDINISDKHYILDFSSLGVGGLILWMPFLKQLENILIMFGNDVWSYFKKYEWITGNNISSDVEDLKSFVNPNYPFYVKTQAYDDPRDLGLKIIGKELKNEVKIKEYLDDFFDVYYSLFGRRFNNVKKQERNIKSEADAGVSGFDVLQSEWSAYINAFLKWISEKTGAKITTDKDKQEQMQQQEKANDVSRMSDGKSINMK